MASLAALLALVSTPDITSPYYRSDDYDITRFIAINTGTHVISKLPLAIFSLLLSTDIELFKSISPLTFKQLNISMELLRSISDVLLPMIFLILERCCRQIVRNDSGRRLPEVAVTSGERVTIFG
ncbi:hypothetical protein DPMN_031634 [Dreissena polymorpha]|uniref:Uncharacterized protein n=1 Tax=Dreissena polymorpha TaxID=45954 RepID=A0A9D4RHH7_DREPO|nr:hypothetical protein DPMN_031634 [Dreissena polymorpha]